MAYWYTGSAFHQIPQSYLLKYFSIQGISIHITKSVNWNYITFDNLIVTHPADEIISTKH